MYVDFCRKRDIIIYRGLLFLFCVIVKVLAWGHVLTCKGLAIYMKNTEYPLTLIDMLKGMSLFICYQREVI